MKIALAQLNYTIGDIDGNASKIIDSINKAKAQRADLVIFAEQAVSGTPAFDLLRKTTFLELCEDALVEIASCCDGIAAIVGLPILTREGTISAAALIQDRKVLRYVGKKYITARREMGFLVPSKGFEYATIKGHKCAIVVGDDLSREHDFDKSVESIRDRLGAKAVPIQFPIGAESSLKGLVDLVRMKAVVWDNDGLGASYKDEEIPADLAEAAAEAREELIQVNGIGEKKADAFGEQFMAAIEEFESEHARDGA